MKVLIAYSSRTGNTRRVAEALAKAAPEGSLLARVEDTPSADGFDVVFAGYWLDRGGPDAKAKEFLHSLHGKHIVLLRPWEPIPDQSMPIRDLRMQGRRSLRIIRSSVFSLCRGLSTPHCWR